MTDLVKLKENCTEAGITINKSKIKTDGNQAVLKVMMGVEDLPQGIYTLADAPVTPTGFVRYQSDKYVAFIEYNDGIEYTKAQIDAIVIDDGQAIPTNNFVSFVIENNLLAQSTMLDSGNWQYWTVESLNTNLSSSSLILHLNPIQLIAPTVLTACKLKRIYIG